MAESVPSTLTNGFPSKFSAGRTGFLPPRTTWGRDPASGPIFPNSTILGRTGASDHHHRTLREILCRMRWLSSSKTDVGPRLGLGTCVPGIFRVTLAFFRPGGKQCNLTLFRLGPGAKQCNLTLFRPPLLPIVQKKSARSSTVSHWAENLGVSAFWNGKSPFLQFWRNPAKMKDLSLETTIFGILAHFCTRCTGFRLVRTMWGRDRAPSM